MPAPFSYTESELKTFMVTTLSDVAVALGWTVATPQVTEAVYATEIACSVADIATATDMAMVRALAVREAWAAAMGAAASRFDAAIAGGPSGRRSQLYDHCCDNWLTAVSAAAIYDDVTNVMQITPITYVPNPYAPENTAAEMG